ncbi:MAG: TetR/AcrR family transcriptional regulator [Balneolaceae bacterium]|nr:MAG: TetR/AcrR family transcriptional regulator [Balneolaceae bacterium]
MKKLSRKERERIARRELIIDTAEEVISNYGFEGATMDAVAEKAELGKGTLYLHFKSKASIYLAICERGSKKLNQLMSKVLAEDLKGIDMIKKLGMVYLDFVKTYPIYFSAFNYYENLIGEEKLAGSELAAQCEEYAREAMAYIVRALQVGMQDGSIKDSYDPRELGLIIWGASKGVVHIAFLKEKKEHMKILDDVSFSLESLVKNFIELIGSGMRSDDHKS